MVEDRKPGSFEHWCPWCGESRVVSYGVPRGRISVLCSNRHCGKPFMIDFATGKIIKTKPLAGVKKPKRRTGKKPSDVA